MGRSRLQRKVARGDEDPGEGSDSLSSPLGGSRWSDGNPNVVEEVQVGSSALEGSLDALYEKRAATREAGLKGLIRAFTQEVMSNYVENKYETIGHQLLTCVKKGGSSEIALAARALGLLVLTLGVGDAASQIKTESEQYLVKIAKSASASTSRIAALEALAIMCFVCNVDEDKEEEMAIFWQIFGHVGVEASDQKLKVHQPPDAVKAAALSGWTLLLSTLMPLQIPTALLTSSFPVLSLLLESQDMAVRRAAGEAAATLYEAIYDGADTGGCDTESTDSSIPDLEEVTKDQVLHQMKTLSVSSTKKFQTRKERALQRKSFRQLLTTLEDGVPREVKIKIPKCKVLIIRTWSETVQLNGLKRFLGEGFQVHMQNNTLLHDIFGIEVEDVPVLLSSKEKKMLWSPNSAACKARTKLLNRTRLNNQAEKTAHFSIDECEID